MQEFNEILGSFIYYLLFLIIIFWQNYIFIFVLIF